jgi:hypothetical protein
VVAIAATAPGRVGSPLVPVSRPNASPTSPIRISLWLAIRHRFVDEMVVIGTMTCYNQGIAH